MSESEFMYISATRHPILVSEADNSDNDSDDDKATGK